MSDWLLLHPACVGGDPRWKLGPCTQTVVETGPAGPGHPLGRDRRGRQGGCTTTLASSVEIRVITDLNLGMKECWPSSAPDFCATGFQHPRKAGFWYFHLTRGTERWAAPGKHLGLPTRLTSVD